MGSNVTTIARFLVFALGWVSLVKGTDIIVLVVLSQKGPDEL